MSSEETPRRASTVLLIRDDPLEVLMVERNARGAFPSALVFPGGAVDPADADASWLEFVNGADRLDHAERANRIAAARELWEETGVCLAVRRDGAALRVEQAAEGMSFQEFVMARQLRLGLDDLVPFGHWVTPVGEPRRFDTRFYLARSPLGYEVVPDGAETLSARWVAPSDAESLAQQANVLFPTLMNLGRLAQSDSVDAAIGAARARAVVTVEPVLGRADDGDIVITIPESAGYPLTEFRVRAPVS